ncbi:hypothetical protein QTL94_20020 [Rhizobium sp. S96]|nr:hypothetical protein [Rhizobium sp. S96]
MMKIIRNVATAENAPYLLALTILIGLVPRALIVADVQSFAVGTACFILSLAICAVGFLSGRFRLLWALWCACFGAIVWSFRDGQSSGIDFGFAIHFGSIACPSFTVAKR